MMRWPYLWSHLSLHTLRDAWTHGRLSATLCSSRRFLGVWLSWGSTPTLDMEWYRRTCREEGTKIYSYWLIFYEYHIYRYGSHGYPDGKKSHHQMMEYYPLQSYSMKSRRAHISGCTWGAESRRCSTRCWCHHLYGDCRWGCREACTSELIYT